MNPLKPRSAARCLDPAALEASARCQVPLAQRLFAPLPGPVGPVVVRPQPGSVVVRPLPGPVGPVVVRPLPSPVIVRPSPVVVRPAPSINIGLTFGAPIHTYAVYTPPVVISEPVCNHFRVVFRASCQEPWRTYKIYHSPQMAREVAEEFGYLGYEAAVYSE